MRREFIQKAEQAARKYREALHLTIKHALPARLLAHHLKVAIIDPSQVPGLALQHVNCLLHKDASAWSAVTIEVEKKLIIVHNTVHAPQRQESNLMHEMAHIICKHRPANVVKTHSLFMRCYDIKQEDEATWLGACLQIPRQALFWAVKRGMSHQEIATYFGASEDLVRFRRNCVGVDKPVTKARRRFQPRRRSKYSG